MSVVLSGRGVDAAYGATPVLDGVSFDLQAGQTLGVIGESGSGKSTLSRVLVGEHPLIGGSISWFGKAALSAQQKTLPSHLRKAFGFVFQDPYATLNPRKPIWWLITETQALLSGFDGQSRKAAAEALAEKVCLSRRSLERYPHALSGGQRQRVAIGRALAAGPSLLILDEPTSALDVSVQAQILNLLLDLQASDALAMLLITHDMAVVRHMSHHLMVLKDGRVVEAGPAADVLSRPRDAYTRSLCEAAFPQTSGAA